jgi:hypothetical protein
LPICFVFILIKILKTKNLQQSILLFLLFCCINILVLNIGFQFNYAEYLTFKSSIFQTLDKNILFSSIVLKIVPSPFLQGIDEVMYMDNLPTGDVRNLPYVFINGDFIFTKNSCKQFFFQTFIFKTPLLFLIGWVICLAIAIKAKKISVELLFGLLPLFILLFFTFFVHSKVGVRHILIIYPFIIMSAAIGYSKIRSQWFIAAFALHFFIIFTYRNNLLAYTNELAINNKTTVNLAGTVNLEYNQCAKNQPGKAFKNICSIDSITNIGDTLSLPISNFFYISDSLNNKSNIFKNYTVLNIDKKNIVTVLKKTDKNKIEP